MVVADEVGEARVVATEATAGGGDRRGGGPAQGERGAEQARAAHELAPGHALGVEVGGGDGGICPGGQLLLGHGLVTRPLLGRQWVMKEVTGSARETIRTSPRRPCRIWSILSAYV